MNPTKNFKGVKLYFRNEYQDFYSIVGTLVLTDFEALFYSDDGKRDMQATFHSVDLVDRNTKNFIFVFFKDFQQWVMSCEDSLFPDLLQAWKEKTQSAGQYYKTNGEYDTAKIFAFNYRSPEPIEEDGWSIYDARNEYQRLFTTLTIENKELRWKISNVNEQYELCPSYPSHIVLPSEFDDADWRKAIEFRDASRAPAVSWIGSHGRAILRCAQPLPGRLGLGRSPQDERLLTLASQGSALAIVDARSRQNAWANQVKGAGFERQENYGGCQAEFIGIENIHVMRDSLEKLQLLCRTVNKHNASWWNKLEATNWMRHIHDVLRGGAKIAQLVRTGTTTIVHCSHGWDRTAQLVALAQLLLDPYYRTIRGFEQLIEKEWCSFGHRFEHRCGHLRHLDPTTDSNETSPIFMQFIDSVWQVATQFPDQFEFNDKFLLTVLEHVYSCRFGTFLFDTERERRAAEVNTHTVSLWSYMNHSTRLHTFVNPFYSRLRLRDYLPFDCAPNKLIFWSALYCRHEFPETPLARLTARVKTMSEDQQLLQEQLKRAVLESFNLKQAFDKEREQLLQRIRQLEGHSEESAGKTSDKDSPSQGTEEKDTSNTLKTDPVPPTNSNPSDAS
jgi:hypothetical protein